MSIASTGLGDDEKRLVGAKTRIGLDPSPDDLPVRYVSVRDWCRITGLGKTTTYAMMADHRIRAIKIGSRTLIDLPFGLGHLASMPAVQLTTGVRDEPAPANRQPRPRSRKRKMADP